MKIAVNQGSIGFAVVLLSSLAGCTGGVPQAPAVWYRCELGIEFSARFVEDTAIIDGSRGYDLLYRPAGTTGRIYANPRMAAEFGVGPSGREAILRYPLLPLVARCVRD